MILGGETIFPSGDRNGVWTKEYLRDFDMVVHRHSKRKCVYAEAIVCKRLGRDEPTRISDQMSRYRSQGYPANAGLHENGIVLRKHNERVRAFNETWWNEIKRGSRRDQLSSTYAAREASLMVAYFPGTLYPAHRATSKLFTLHPHNRSRPSNGAK